MIFIHLMYGALYTKLTFTDFFPPLRNRQNRSHTEFIGTSAYCKMQMTAFIDDLVVRLVTPTFCFYAGHVVLLCLAEFCVLPLKPSFTDPQNVNDMMIKGTWRMESVTRSTIRSHGNIRVLDGLYTRKCAPGLRY